jgi:hypothetical protein
MCIYINLVVLSARGQRLQHRSGEREQAHQSAEKKERLRNVEKSGKESCRATRERQATEKTAF